MDNLIKTIAAAGFIGALLMFQGFGNPGKLHPDAPDGAVHYAENIQQGTSITLYADEVYLVTKSQELSIPLGEVKDHRRNITRFRISGTDNSWMEFSFLSLLEAKAFEKKLGEQLRKY